jgi:predicted adenylyl cyclase CyaB
MPRNVEIKARIESVEALLPRVSALAGKAPVEIPQDDTFFRCDNGRLKLRVFADGRGELIFYRRQDQKGPKVSFFVRSPASDPQSLRELLSFSYGTVGRVQKSRHFFIIGRSRIHLDRVNGLGDFIEIEVVLDDDEPADVGVEEANQLMAELGVAASQLVEDAYVDLLARA